MKLKQKLIMLVLIPVVFLGLGVGVSAYIPDSYTQIRANENKEKIVWSGRR